MTQPDVDAFVNRRARKVRWDSFLPKRKAWFQTLILLPFALPVANFLGSSWQFSANSIVEERQYVIGILSMAVNLFLPPIFFAFLFHWGWFIWRQQDGKTWYPTAPALKEGAYATLTLAVSFAVVAAFARTFSVCGNPVWGDIGKQFICNLDGYGFEAKSWVGAWCIVAAYCYHCQRTADALPRLFRRRHRDFTTNSIATPLQGSMDSIASNGEE